MPLWNVYYPEGAYTVEDKEAFAEAITGLYTRFNLPAFYVSVMFHELASDTFYVGGEQASGYIRIWVDHIARRIPDEGNRWWMDEVNKLIAPYTAERGHRWELHIDNTPMELWTIDGFYPPPADSEEEKRWARDNRALAPRRELRDGAQVMTTDERLLSTDTATAVINAPIAQVDIGDWIFHLPDAEYQRCAPGQHIAAGVTTTDDGRPMSINVEQVAGTLLVQHYVPEVLEPHHCVLVSQTDLITPRGRTTFQITWEVSAEADGDGRCTYTNTVSAHATDEFLSFLADQGIGVEQGAAERQENMTAHNQLETPLFAKSIERRALGAMAPDP